MDVALTASFPRGDERGSLRQWTSCASIDGGSVLSARSFFYKYYLGASDQKSYAEANYPDLAEELAVPPHVPRRSNDALLEEYMDDLVAVAPEEYRDRIDGMFVGKLHDFEANAAAMLEDEHYGDLIFFNVGLSDACFQYSMLFHQLVKLIGLRTKAEGDRSSEVANYLQVLGGNLTKLKSAQDRWNESGKVSLRSEDEVAFYKQDLELAVAIACTTDRFVLFHEVCHHLLGHTSGGALHFIDTLPDGCRAWEGTTNEHHRQEYQADAGAIMLSLWSSSKESVDVVGAVLGTLLSLTVLGQFTKDASVASETHPSTLARFEQALAVLGASVPRDELDPILDDVERLQLLLSGTQDRGIGGLRAPISASIRAADLNLHPTQD